MVHCVAFFHVSKSRRLHYGDLNAGAIRYRGRGQDVKTVACICWLPVSPEGRKAGETTDKRPLSTWKATVC